MRTALATAIVALVTLSASNAIAACKQAALKGTWQFTALDIFENSQSLAFTGTNIEDCTFKINPKGVITNVSCSDISADEADVYLNGTFEINTSCAFTLQVPGCTLNGKITKNQQAASGVGLCATNTDVNTLSFDLVKQ